MAPQLLRGLAAQKGVQLPELRRAGAAEKRLPEGQYSVRVCTKVKLEARCRAHRQPLKHFVWLQDPFNLTVLEWRRTGEARVRHHVPHQTFGVFQ
eukprot:4621355-Lingulodinium_polyedra.AAC.1